MGTLVRRMTFRIVEMVGTGEAVERRTPLPHSFKSEVAANAAITRIIREVDQHGYDDELRMYWMRRPLGGRVHYFAERVTAAP